MKGFWEKRVGLLLDPALHPETFAYSFKPTDSAMYGGQPRIDWLAADMRGRFWLIEVKSLPDNRRGINVQKDVSVGQRAALSAVGRSAFGLPLLAVGQGSFLHVFAWRDVVDRAVVPLAEAPVHLSWSGPKDWKRYRVEQIAEDQGWFRWSHPTSVPLVLYGSVGLATRPAPPSSSASSTNIPEPPSP